jgi:maleylpyruvate isomerase
VAERREGDTVPLPAEELAGAREATVRLRALVDRTPDLLAPSLLPGWTRAHVVAHIAGNARSHIRMLRGAQEDQVLDQYPGGAEARASAIKELAEDPAAAVEELHRSAEDLAHAWRGTADWTAQARPLDSEPVPVVQLVWARWREVEVHAVDLAGDYQPRDWPQPFLDRLLAELRSRTDLPRLDGVTGPDHALAAWLSGRSAGQGLQGVLPHLPEWR